MMDAMISVVIASFLNLIMVVFILFIQRLTVVRSSIYHHTDYGKREKVTGSLAKF